MSPKRWSIAAQDEQAEALASRLKTSPLIAQILLNRGIKEVEACHQFLNPSLRMLHEPQRLANLMAAAERIDRAIRDGQKIVIYGDYDVDGITGTAILWHAIRLLGGTADYYIPHRLDEGYGLNAEAIEQICAEGARVIVTVDCGITAIDEASLARQRGVDLIITDHHDWRDSSRPVKGCETSPETKPAGTPLLPECYAIVHPRLPGEGSAYPNPGLCGSGVAFKLAWGLGQIHDGAARVNAEYRKFLVEATALAALGTIADVVQLTGENRILAHFGLLGLKNSALHGVRALIESAHLTGQKLDAYHAGFLLAPRLNACGRMGHARQAVEMLTHATEAEAKQIAGYLEEQNRARQTLERRIFQEAVAQVEQHGYCDSDECRGLVLAMEGWHPGVIGIVASRIVSKFNRPAILVAFSEGQGHGSGRSIPGFHLARALSACREHLESCGGHEMAAGLRLEAGKFADFRDAFMAYARQTVSAEMLIPELKLDCVAELSEVTESLVNDFQRLGPFGPGNRKPLLACLGVEVAAPPRRCGRTGDHVQFAVRQGRTTMKCIAFNRPDLLQTLHRDLAVDLAAEPTCNGFHGTPVVELEVKDVRLAETLAGSTSGAASRAGRPAAASAAGSDVHP